MHLHSRVVDFFGDMFEHPFSHIKYGTARIDHAIRHRPAKPPVKWHLPIRRKSMTRSAASFDTGSSSTGIPPDPTITQSSTMFYQSHNPIHFQLYPSLPIRNLSEIYPKLPKYVVSILPFTLCYNNVLMNQFIKIVQGCSVANIWVNFSIFFICYFFVS